MKKIQLKTEDQEKIFGILRVLFPKAKLYLFGSRAQGASDEYSDVDIAIDEGKEIALHRIGEAKAMFAESNITLKIDLVDIHYAPQALVDAIKRDGILWKK